MIRTTIKGISLTFETDPGLFSPGAVDRGTLAMLSVVQFDPEDKVLDLGCGWGVVGVLAARIVGAGNVVMLDNDPTAVALAGRNAALNGVPGVFVVQSDGFQDLSETDFTLILCNPPYHADFSVAKHFVHKGFNRLRIGGRMYMVTKRKLWYRKKLTGIFGGVQVREIDGYSVFESVKKRATYAKTLAKKRT